MSKVKRFALIEIIIDPLDIFVERNYAFTRYGERVRSRYTINVCINVEYPN